MSDETNKNVNTTSTQEHTESSHKHHSSSSHHHHSSSSHRHSSSSSHHHSSSSKKKSSKKHKKSSSETKGVKIGRDIIAFGLFLTISLLSLMVCVKVAFVSPQSVVKIFVNEEYVLALRDDIIRYSHDKCDACMLPEDTLDEAITYEDLYALENAYISGAVNASNEFTKTTYEDNAAGIKAKVKTAINDRIKAESLRVDKKQKDGASKLTQDINDYILNRLEISNIDKLETFVNIGKIVSIVGIIVLSVFAVVFALIVISIGSKRYRALRWVIHSVNAAAVLNLLLVFGVEIVKHVKSLVLYPTYIADAFMRYVNKCEMAVGASSIILFSIALILTSVVWKMNRDSKE